MTDEKVYTNEVIKDAPFPQEGVAEGGSSQSTKDVYTPNEIKETPFPTKKTANEVLSASLNTKSRKILGVFQFTKYGAIQVGTLEVGVSGEIKISPVGIVAKNKSGETTFAIDGDTGDASFKGTVRASTFISDNLLTGQINVGQGIGGAYVRLDGPNNRIIVHDGSYPRIVIGNV